ncbi:hypothetical protein KI688_008361 [Linnemannia hyalina]|uniref:Uncharacterized protein n=1 Tax=Linnemannia hyalina TaxID=64524 RepID=A0A9P7Y0R7_9FUNG|nr:hypothetical protein KI688_008361 [Linnemannia hyalina]
MLLLVPSHKTDEEGVGKDAAPPSRVLVLLSSDTDISSNVIVPDTAITTTLGTNDTLEIIAGNFPHTPLFNPAAFFTQPKHSRDHLGILQPSRPDDPFNGFQQPSQQSNVYRSQDHMDDSRSRRQPSQPDQRTLHPYGGNNPNYSRARRHSHTGLVEFDYSVGPSISGPRLRARQSISLAAPYQHQSFRTPRLLRGAFRKARKEQSPLLTSGGFGTDYTMQNPAEEWEGDDIFLPWKTVSSIPEQPSYPSTTLGSTNPRSLLHGVGSISHLSNPRGEQLEGEIINNKSYADLDSIDSGDDIELDGDENNRDRDTTAMTTKSPTIPPVPPKRGHRDSSEFVDVDGLSDEEMAADESSKAPTTADESPTNSKARVDQWLKDGMDNKTLDRADLEIDLENSLDADMNTILGMASDMELVMPKFDDNYLQDLNTEPALTAFTRGRSSSASNAVSPSCSHSSSTTITCISSHSSPSQSTATGFPGPTILAHGGSSPLQSNTTGQRTTEQPSAGQDLSSFHRDIDILRRHREGLKGSPELPTETSNPRLPSLLNSSSCGSNPSTLSSSASPPSSTTDEQGMPASQGPIYFNPSHHNLANESAPGEQHPHQNVMIIQSNQWTMDNNKGVTTGTRVFPQSMGIRRNEGNHIYMVRECSPTPSPPPLLDKSAIMTTHNISLATANMNVLTPQEVQEDYYTRRNMRLNRQRQRRRSSAAVAGAAEAVAATATTGGASGESRSLRLEGVSPLASTSSSSSSTSSRSASVHGSDLIHPLDINYSNNNNKSIVPVPAISATLLPMSYYIPPSAFRTEAAVAAEREREMGRKRKEEEEALKNSFLVFPSPTLL